MKRRRRIVLAVAAVTLLGACSSSADESQDTAGVEELAQEVSSEAAGTAGDGAATPAAAPPEAEGAPLPPAGQQVAATADGERVIKEGTIALDVEARGFDTAFAAVVEAARRRGGSLVGSETFTEDDADGGVTGSLTVRVPVEEYEDLLVAVAEVGEVRRRSITAEDVSAEFVDLQARQRNLEAQERFYLGLIDEAQTVEGAIAVQQQLESVTERLEQVKGRVTFLDDRTSFSTLTVELREPAAAEVLSGVEQDRPSLAAAWRTAQDAFLNVVGALVIVAGFVLPLLLIALTMAGLVLLVRSWFARRGPHQPPSRPATSGATSGGAGTPG